MPCLKRCCCCVTLRMGGITMGVMTLALSVFSIVPAVLSFIQREQMARQVYKLMKRAGFYGGKTAEDGEDGEADPTQWLWGAVNQIAKTVTNDKDGEREGTEATL